jgi:AcrR family transcriptional regulator
MSTKSRSRADPTREEQTRADIVAATKRLVQKHGLRKVTMEDIALAVGKRKSFLYYYFPGKREVIHAMIEAEFGEMRQAARVATSGRTGAADKIQRYLSARIEAVVKQAASFGPSSVLEALQGNDAGTDFASMVEARQTFDRGEESFLAGLVRQGIQEGAFRPLSDKVINDMTYFMFSALRGLELEMVLSRDSRPSPGPRMTTVLGIFLRGLAT